ncbi:hypothetical protein [Chryseobacterium sp. 22543]|uniref:hypothetical protein n=1 Tax=Chryseobacterium sp. 22543 TaxID=3453940 RepID=UPI003F86DB2F
MSDIVPAWLKAMQNGALGEARAKAFLMDRFWILERSVDIEGADLIIQRRITQRNLLDKKPPNFGIVQVKFFESEKTTQFIPTDYILDKQGNAREDFFVLLHTGFEEQAKIYFLTADVIKTDFQEVEAAGINKFKIKGSQLFRTEKYLVKSNSNTLTRIENRLEFADFKKNREFISWKLPNTITNTSAILPDYREEIENSWGNIPNEFQRIKDNALKSMREVEEIFDSLKEIANEIDPIKAFSKIEEFNLDFGKDYYGPWGRTITDGLYDEDFYFTCKNHKDKVDNLKSDGLLDEYIAAKSAIISEVIEFFSNRLPIDKNTVHSMIIRFSTANFQIQSVNHRLISASEYFNVPNTLNKFGVVNIPNYYSGIKDISEDTFEYYWLAGRIIIDEQCNVNLIDLYRKNLHSVYRECLDKMYDLKYEIKTF